MKKIIVLTFHALFSFLSTFSCQLEWADVQKQLVHINKHSTNPCVGGYSWKGIGKEVCEDRYDIVYHPQKGIGVAVFGGHGGSKEITKDIKECFLHDVAMYSTASSGVCYGSADGSDPQEYYYKGASMCNSLAEGFKEVEEFLCEGDMETIEEGVIEKLKKMQMQGGASVCASWFNPQSQTGDLMFVGDCVAFLIGGNQLSITTPHVPTEKKEEKRIRMLGGRIIKGLVEGQLRTSRSLGDKLFKEQHPGLVIAEPEYHAYKTDNDYDYLIVTSKGFYDILHRENEQSMYEDFQNVCTDILILPKQQFHIQYPLNEVHMRSDETSSSDGGYQGDCDTQEDVIAENALQEKTEYGQKENVKDSERDDSITMVEFAKRLVHVAISRGSQDDMTAVVVRLSQHEVV